MENGGFGAFPLLDEVFDQKQQGIGQGRERFLMILLGFMGFLWKNRGIEGLITEAFWERGFWDFGIGRLSGAAARTGKGKEKGKEKI